MGKQFYFTFVLVMLVDLLVILGTEQMLGGTYRWVRWLFASVFGGCHAALCMVPGCLFLRSGIWRLILLLTSGCIAFDFHPKKIAAYCIISLSLGNLAFGLEGGSVTDAVISGVALLVLFLIFLRNHPSNRNYANISIPTPDGVVRVTALHDTGNSLTDPVTGDPVLIVSSHLCNRLLGVDASVLSDPIGAMHSVKACRLIPYHTVSGKGLLIAKRFKNVTVNDKMKSVLIAFSPNIIGNGKQFNALTGGLTV